VAVEFGSRFAEVPDQFVGVQYDFEFSHGFWLYIGLTCTMQVQQ
jgi:hypothetical protein